MLFNLLLVAGAAVLCAGLRTFRHPSLFRLGTLGLVGTSFLAGWLLGGSLITGGIFAATWFLMPWLEILTRVRRMRLPVERCVSACAPPSRATFPLLGDLSDEMEAGGFEHAEDVSWTHDETTHFYRLYMNPERTTIGAISLVEQPELSFYYISFRTRAADGRVATTWNYPFSFGLHPFPGSLVQRLDGGESVLQMLERHGEIVGETFGPGGCAVSAVSPSEELQRDLRGQLDHNLACGILCREGDQAIRYTARGMFFLWFQFLRDFVRFS